MKQIALVVLIPILVGLIASEATELSPWLARRTARKAARLWAGRDLDRAELLAEEWAALINDCPGKLNKLVRAAAFVFSGLWRAQRRGLQRAVAGARSRADNLLGATLESRSLYVAVASLIMAVATAVPSIWSLLAGEVSWGLAAATLEIVGVTVGMLVIGSRVERRRRGTGRLFSRAAICVGQPGAKHAKAVLTQGRLVGHRAVFGSCPTCGATRQTFLTPRRPIDSGS